VRRYETNQFVGGPMCAIERDDKFASRFTLGEVHARMMIQLLDDVLPLILRKAFDSQFAPKQKLRLVCCFMGFSHGLAPLNLCAQPLSQHPKLNCN
jgi:hypothetical protein